MRRNFFIILGLVIFGISLAGIIMGSIAYNHPNSSVASFINGNQTGQLGGILDGLIDIIINAVLRII
jgi:hypothetical protein